MTERNDAHQLPNLDDYPRLVLRAEHPLRPLIAKAAELMLRHPVAAQALFTWLVAEGRRFGATSDGVRWRAALTESPMLQEARALWEESALNFLEDHPASVLPSAIADVLIQRLSGLTAPPSLGS